MSTSTTAVRMYYPPAPRARVFVRHYIEMVLAMYVGMVGLGAVFRSSSLSLEPRLRTLATTFRSCSRSSCAST